MKELLKKDIKKIRKLLREGNSELNIAVKSGSYIEIYGYVSYKSIKDIIKEGYFIYHSKLNNSAMMVCKW